MRFTNVERGVSSLALCVLAMARRWFGLSCLDGVGFGFGLDTVDALIIGIYAWPGLALGVDARATSLWVYAFLLYAISDTEGNGPAMSV